MATLSHRSDAAAPPSDRELAHELPVPGWPPRPPDAVLRRSHLETYRLRRLERLRLQRPGVHSRVVAWLVWSRRFWDRVMPRERIAVVTFAVLGLTVFDGLATLLLVDAGLAEEANPLLAEMIENVGLVPTMAARVVVGGTFTIVLAWLSTWRREARPVLALVAVLLSAVTCMHLAGTVWTIR